MNRRHVLQTLAVMSAGSTTIVALGESSSGRLNPTAPRNVSATLLECRELCIDLLGRLDRADSRGVLVAGQNSTANKSAIHSLQELSVLLERTEARIADTELRAVALFQACMDSLLRVEMPLNSLCQQGTLPRPDVDSAVAVFGQARQLLSSHRVA